MTRRLCCEQLETRDCPTVLFPNPPAPVNPGLNTYEFRVTGVSSDGNQDLIVINPAGLGFVEVLHHRGYFQLENGIVYPFAPGVEEIGRHRMLARTTLTIVVHAGDGSDFIVNNTGVRCWIDGGNQDDYVVGGSETTTCAAALGTTQSSDRAGTTAFAGRAVTTHCWAGRGTTT